MNSPDRVLTRQVFELHGVTTLLLPARIGLHVAAALYHHFILRDDVLRRRARYGDPDSAGLIDREDGIPLFRVAIL